VSYSLMRRDLEPDMLIQMEAPGAIAALTGALSVDMEWEKPDGTVSTVGLSVVDLVKGIVKRVWQNGDSDQVGEHLFTVRVTAANGEVASDPNDGSYARWWVYARLGD
jgi:hypothetical protein